MSAGPNNADLSDAIRPVAPREPHSLGGTYDRYGPHGCQSGRVLLAANRLPLPLSHPPDAAEVRVGQGSSGGLVSALRYVHENLRCIWFGARTPGPGNPSDEFTVCPANDHTIAIPISRTEADAYYRRVCNEHLWPALHSLDVKGVPCADDWSQYVAINARFANAIARSFRPGDVVWVHDYHLMLVPAMVRARVPDAPIAFFLHTPMPGSRALNAVREWPRLLEGILTADAVGLQTADDELRLKNTLEAIGPSWRRRFGSERRAHRIEVRPIGVDTEWFARVANRRSTMRQVSELRTRCPGPLFLGVDRLDYTKGIPERLAAFGRLLTFEPGLRGRAHFIQIAVPSREDAAGYAELRAGVEAKAAEINAAFGSVDWTPVEIRLVGVAPEDLVAFYRAADVMVVTPPRDGMNLVAKEFVASRIDHDGVLVLSRGAGAAHELRAAVLVDGEDADSILWGLRHAVRMSAVDRCTRMRRLRARVVANDVGRWTTQCLDPLRRIAAARAAESWSD